MINEKTIERIILALEKEQEKYDYDLMKYNIDRAKAASYAVLSDAIQIVINEAKKDEE